MFSLHHISPVPFVSISTTHLCIYLHADVLERKNAIKKTVTKRAVKHLKNTPETWHFIFFQDAKMVLFPLFSIILVVLLPHK